MNTAHNAARGHVATRPAPPYRQGHTNAAPPTGTDPSHPPHH